MTPKEWLTANATLKDSAKIEEFETLVSDLDPLKNIKTKEDALNFIDRNNLFKSGLDSVISKAVSSHDEKFTADKLPALIKEAREEAIREANPEETETDKRLRALEESNKEKDLIIANGQKKDLLTAKAKEIGFRGDIERYSRLSGEKALEYLVSDYEANSKYLKDKEDVMKKDIYKDNPPPEQGEEENNDFNLGSEMSKLSFLNQ